VSLSLSHHEIEELLGAFALDSVDPEEWEAIDVHLRGCPRCRAEVAEHREVAALLAHSGAPAPDGVWDRILDELEPPAPALRLPMPGSPLDAALSDSPRDRVTNLGARRSSARTRILTAILAAAAVIVAVLGSVTVHQTRRLDRLDRALRDVSVDRVASQAMSDPQAASGKLISGDGRINAPVVVNAAGKGYLFASKLPELPRDRTYQLWGQVRGATVSLGVFDGGTDVVQFQVGADQLADLSRLLVTQETSPGVPASRHRAFLAGSV